MKTCSIAGCWKKHNCHGLCKQHYDVTRREKRNISTLRYRVNNAAKVKAASVKWWKRNPTKRKEYAKKGRQENPAERSTRNAKWRKEHPGYNILSAKQWAKANPARVSARNMERIARKLRATPQWVNRFYISEAYDLAHIRTGVFGFVWHVDHIVPLKSKRVCGLHCEFNLRVIPGRDNIVKNNRVWPDMP